MQYVSRREFVGVMTALGVMPALACASAPRRPKVAVLLTAFFPRSHAHVILENFLEPYLFNGKLVKPPVDLVSFYVEQFPPNDMARDVARQYGIPIYPTIDAALCLGGDRLAADAVLAIGEHGDYPTNDLGQVEYPRKRFFDETVAVFRRSGKCVPYFNDKHLSYRWDWAREMVQEADELGFPLMAGSSVPLAERQPPLDLPPDARIVEAVSIHSGPLERYDFHALENLQSLVEARSGGETGVNRVEFLDTDSLWNAAAAGRWNTELAVAALRADRAQPFTTLDDYRAESHGILIDYRDGTRGVMLRVGGHHTRWNVALKLAGEPKPLATRYYVGPWNHRNLFKALSHAIQHLFVTGQAPYPVQRTLLTSGILDAAMHSRAQGRPLETPQLHLAYKPVDFRPMRELGASWKIITEETAERPGMAPLGEAVLP